MNNAAKQNILVTGGTGFAGKYAIKRLTSKGHSVFSIVRTKEKFESILNQNNINQKLVKTIQIEHPEKMEMAEIKKIIEKNEITTIVHIAALSRENSAVPWEEYFTTNVLWTRNLAMGFINSKVKHNKFIFTSSVGVYGTIPSVTPANEETIYNPDGKYHKSKMMAEQELLNINLESSFPLIILRPSIMYGIGDLGFLYKIFKLSKRKIYPLSSNNPIFHLLDVETLSEVYSKIVENKNAKYGIFNVSDKDPISATKLLTFIKSSTSSNYLRIPSSFFKFLKALSSSNAQRSITFKLINENWFYNVGHLYETFDLEAESTLGNLHNKYLSWYNGAI
ncbi:NAD-dependent epimerase/dehydratase family protein [Candidatus Bathyarchaeota archaeon]|nr:NAD-dependent epimerase/dehydratase family protein [Candidatus Bathyarchaeota archaeon]